MIRSAVSVFCVLLMPCMIAAQTSTAKEPKVRPVPAGAVKVINPETARRHLEMLASDAMLGRDTPSPELDSAARYIAGMFKKYGLESVNGSYFHVYNLRRLELGARNELSVNGKTCAIKTDFIPFDFSGTDSVTAPVVFAGYGIHLAAKGYDDYDGLNVRGKIVLVVAGMPRVFFPPPPARTKGDTSPPPRRELAMFRSISVQEKARLAGSHGAVAIIVVQSPAQYSTLRPTGYPWPSLFDGAPGRGAPMQLDLPDTTRRIPAVSAGDVAARALWGSSYDKFADRIRLIDSTGKPGSMPFDHSEATVQVTITKTLVPVNNVVGVVRGGTLPDEYIVVGAHYDHIGHGVPRRRNDTAAHTAIPADTIYNGADDNASGTTGLLLNAAAFASLPGAERPARSILFIAFSGEEKGLYGSRAFVDAPSVPVASMAAMFNMDMIGRNSPDSVQLVGVTRSPDLVAICNQANKAEPMTFFGGEEYFFRSDQASFARKRVPCLFFSTGEHKDYHQVSDSPDKIDYNKLVHIARLCFRTVWMTSETPARPRYVDAADDR